MLKLTQPEVVKPTSFFLKLIQAEFNRIGGRDGVVKATGFKNFFHISA
jgi:hypothetical protein